MPNRQTQCHSCHRYLTGAPHPDVDHQGAPHGSLCTLEHHPPPCAWVDESGAGCAHHLQVLHEPPPVSEPEAVSDEVALLREQMARLQAERDEERRCAELLHITNSNQKLQAVSNFPLMTLAKLVFFAPLN